jgi:DNA-directed RNA polymerase specialized sigma24 family protein
VSGSHVTGRAGGLVALPEDDPERRAAFEHARSCADCARELEEAAQAIALLGSLRFLPPPPPAVVHLHRYEGMTFGEIAKVLGTSEVAVRARAFRAYEQLRRALASFSSSRRSS